MANIDTKHYRTTSIISQNKKNVSDFKGEMDTTTNEVKFERNCFMFGEELTAVIGLPSKTLIYPSMEQHHSLCSDRNYWYRNCSSQRDYIIDLLEIFSSTEKCLLLSRHASIVLWFCSLSVLASNYIYIYMTLPLSLSYIYVLNEFLLFFSICWDSEIHCKNRHIIIDQFRWH